MCVDGDGHRARLARLRRRGVVLLVSGGCASRPASQDVVLLLDEGRHALLRMDPVSGEFGTATVLDVPEAQDGDEGTGVEGLAFVSNEEVSAHGLLELPVADNEGYLLLSSQRAPKLWVFDVGLRASAETALPIWEATLPGIERDLSELCYVDGVLWVALASDRRLVRYDVARKDPSVTGSYDVSVLGLGDVEGLAFAGRTAFLADDRAKAVVRYADFPDCLGDGSCSPTWRTEFPHREPSGLAWDVDREVLWVADDRGQVLALSDAGAKRGHAFEAPGDLEAVVIDRASEH